MNIPTNTTITVKGISVLTNQPGMDIVFVKTDMPSPAPAVTDEPMVLRFEVEAGKGVEYVQKNFSCSGYALDTETGEKTWFGAGR